MSARKAKPNPAMKLIVVSNQSSLRLCSFPPRVSSRCDSPPPLPERHFPTQKNGVRLSHAVFLLSKRGIIAGLGLSLGCTRFFRRQMFRARSPRSRCFQTHTRTHTHTHARTKGKILANQVLCWLCVQAVSWCQTHYRFLCVLPCVIVRALHPGGAHTQSVLGFCLFVCLFFGPPRPVPVLLVLTSNVIPLR